MPKIGSELSMIGKIAQCIAQATEAPTPKASQFIFNLIFQKSFRQR